MNAEVKVAKINRDIVAMQIAKETGLALLNNPAVELLGGTLLIELWAKNNDSGSWYGETLEAVGKTALETTLGLVCVAHALGGGQGVASVAGALMGKAGL